jgi:hypothetical protein
MREFVPCLCVEIRSRPQDGSETEDHERVIIPALQILSLVDCATKGK